MAVGNFRIDNETLAITVLVGAGLLYYFTRDVETQQEQNNRRNDDRKGIAQVNLDTLEHRYDDLNLGDLDPEKALITVIESQLTQICEDTMRLQSESGDIEGMKEDFFQHTSYLIRSCRDHLEKDAELKETDIASVSWSDSFCLEKTNSKRSWRTPYRLYSKVYMTLCGSSKSCKFSDMTDVTRTMQHPWAGAESDMTSCQPSERRS